MLTNKQIEQFIASGYVRIEQAFSRELADRCRKILWADTECDPGDRSTWKQPVVWLPDHSEPPFVQAANTQQLHAAFDQLVGQGRWQPRFSSGYFPVRFPSHKDTEDTGWHVDSSFPGEDSDPSDFTTWRINIHSRDRALLMLFLFSDVGEQDAPTRLRCGSHREVARILAPAGEEGLAGFDLSAQLSITENCPEATATGAAGTVYLCHPFLAHAAQINRGSQPRFMAQPPLYPVGAFKGAGKQTSPIAHIDQTTSSIPIEEAVCRALRKPAPDAA
ncbi:phytanoyl-CoA dioxygenase family protein [Nodosilinea nodulosa]|uniref:phytanoyl-CoA dioxygenase family protein n=1 Tax=Nodosilinea nodulosa TaxID=416001 RepID=UPI0003775D11|nr:phytanoyl-CoA dioxygenase family protein [Nodosilinea nodulosa]